MFLAHIRESDNTGQTVYEHSKNTALLTECFIQPVGLYFSNMLRKKRMGGKAEFEPGSKVMIMELNAATTGRLSMQTQTVTRSTVIVRGKTMTATGR